jgi:heterodisulfide reductase subunit A-like polyferredoxin
MTAANSLASQGYVTHIVETGDRLGGNAHQPFQNHIRRDLVSDKLAALSIQSTLEGDNIKVHLNTRLAVWMGLWAISSRF